MHPPPTPGRREAPLTRDFALRVGLAWITISALLILVNWPRIAGGVFPDPDDAMRLIQVRDWLGGQSWFDLRQYRVDAPGGGVPMHWSRLVDVPLAAVILVLTPLLGAQAAQSAAIILIPLLSLAAAMVLAARIAWRLLGVEETTLTALILALSVPVIFQLGPMRIDHHGWQLVCALAALNGLTARSGQVGGAVIGASLAVWLAISIEGLPLSAAIFAVLALRWLRDPSEREWLASAMLALFLTSCALFIGTRGLSDLAAHCDAIGPVHLAMFGVGAGVLWPLARLGGHLSPAALLGGFALTASGALGLLLYAAPQCAIGGGFAALDPLVRDFWYVHVSEGMPIWHQSVSVALQYAVTPVIGLWAAAQLARRSDGWHRRFWSDYALILSASILVALMVARAGATACLIAAPPLAWQLARWLKGLREAKRPLPRLAGLAAITVALLPTFPLVLSGLILPARASGVAEVDGQLKTSDCRIEASAELLNALEPGEIFAPLDIAPQLLLVSHHWVPATAHHRGDQTIRLVIATSLGPSEAARATLRERGSRYVALCPGLFEPRNYAASASDGFAADLLEGRAPAWLEPIPTAAGTSLRLWRIRPE